MKFSICCSYILAGLIASVSLATSPSMRIDETKSTQPISLEAQSTGNLIAVGEQSRPTGCPC